MVVTVLVVVALPVRRVAAGHLVVFDARELFSSIIDNSDQVDGREKFQEFQCEKDTPRSFLHAGGRPLPQRQQKTT